MDLDEMGPKSVKSHPAVSSVPAQVAPHGVHAARAKQEIDYGRRGKGSIFGAFQAATGEALSEPYLGRTTANFVDFLEKVDAWIPTEVERVYAILANLAAHRVPDVLLFSVGVRLPPKYAAYLNLIEAWWKILRSLVFKGRRFATWAEVCQAVQTAAAYWTALRHPFVWARARQRRRRVRVAPLPGFAALPKVA